MEKGTPLGGERGVRRRTERTSSPLSEMDGLTTERVDDERGSSGVQRELFFEGAGETDILGAIKELTAQVRDLKVNAATKTDIGKLQEHIVTEAKHFVNSSISEAI